MYPQNSEENITVPENGNTSSEDTVDDTATGADHSDEEGEMGMYAVVDEDQFLEIVSTLNKQILLIVMNIMSS